MTQSSIGLIGLGLMGLEIAQRLISASCRVHGTDLAEDRCRLAAAIGVEVHPTTEPIFDNTEIVILSLPNDSVVASVLDAAHLRPSHTIIDTTTGSPESTEQLAARFASQSIEVVDATISGSSAQLRNGSAVIIAGATSSGWSKASHILHALTTNCFHVGPPGAGARMKLVTNLVLGLNRAALAEGLAYAQAQGLDLSLTLQLLKATPAYSRMMDTKGDKMIQRDFTPQAKLSQHLKDVNLIIDTAREHNLHLPLSEAHKQLLQTAEQLGYGQLDNSALINAYHLAKPTSE